MKNLYKTLLAFALISLLPFSAVQAAGETTIYLVRHAEKTTEDTPDPELTTLGKQRAQSFAKLLENENITAIFSTPFIRTMKTAQPTADHHGLAVQQYDPGQPQALVGQLKLLHGTVLVTGHSNTIPELVNLLSGEAFEDLDERVYDKVYKVTLSNGQHTSLEISFSEPRTPLP